MKHLDHLEDDFLFNYTIPRCTDFHLKQYISNKFSTYGSVVSTKFDGKPCLIVIAMNNNTYVATKSLFNKTEKSIWLYNIERSVFVDSQFSYRDRPRGVSDDLCCVMDEIGHYFSEYYRSTSQTGILIVSGDVIKRIGRSNKFKSNICTYEIDRSSMYYVDTKNTELQYLYAVHFITSKSLYSNPNLEYIRNLLESGSSNLIYDDFNIRVYTPNFMASTTVLPITCSHGFNTQLQSKNIIEMIDSMFILPKRILHEFGNFLYDYSAELKIYLNSFIRDNNDYSNANLNNFCTFLKDRLIDKMSTNSGSKFYYVSVHNKVREIDVICDCGINQNIFAYMIQVYTHIIEIKHKLIDICDKTVQSHVKCIGVSEGYVIGTSDKLKLVNRRSFSYENFKKNDR